MQLKSERSISFGEAKKQYTAMHTSLAAKNPEVSYAAICKSTRTISTQTDLTWPKSSSEPTKLTEKTPSQHSTYVQTGTDDPPATAGAAGWSHISPKSRSNKSRPVILSAAPNSTDKAQKAKAKTTDKPKMIEQDTANRFTILSGSGDCSEHDEAGDPPDDMT